MGTGSLDRIHNASPPWQPSSAKVHATQPTTTLGAAVASGDAEAVASILQQNRSSSSRDTLNAQEPQTQRTPLHIAASTGNTAMARMLLQHGAHPNARDSDGLTPLHYAVKLEHKGMVDLLLGASASPNVPSAAHYTPVHYACRNGDPSILRALLLCRGRKDAKTKDTRATPMHVAALGRNTAALKVLLEPHHGDDFDINAADRHGYTPLQRAVQAGDTGMVRALVAAGASRHFRGKWDWTALHWAAHYGHRDVVAALLELGSNPGAEDTDGNTPFDVAKDDSVRAMMLNKGGRSLAPAASTYRPRKEGSSSRSSGGSSSGPSVPHQEASLQQRQRVTTTIRSRFNDSSSSKEEEEEDDEDDESDFEDWVSLSKGRGASGAAGRRSSRAAPAPQPESKLKPAAGASPSQKLINSYAYVSSDDDDYEQSKGALSSTTTPAPPLPSRAAGASISQKLIHAFVSTDDEEEEEDERTGALSSPAPPLPSRAAAAGISPAWSERTVRYEYSHTEAGPPEGIDDDDTDDDRIFDAAPSSRPSPLPSSKSSSPVVRAAPPAAARAEAAEAKPSSAAKDTPRMIAILVYSPNDPDTGAADDEEGAAIPLAQPGNAWHLGLVKWLELRGFEIEMVEATGPRLLDQILSEVLGDLRPGDAMALVYCGPAVQAGGNRYMAPGSTSRGCTPTKRELGRLEDLMLESIASRMLIACDADASVTSATFSSEAVVPAEALIVAAGGRAAAAAAAADKSLATPEVLCCEVAEAFRASRMTDEPSSPQIIKAASAAGFPHNRGISMTMRQ